MDGEPTEKPSKRRQTGSLHELLGKLMEEDGSGKPDPVEQPPRRKTALLDKLIVDAHEDAAREAGKQLAGMAQEQNEQAATTAPTAPTDSDVPTDPAPAEPPSEPAPSDSGPVDSADTDEEH